MARNLFASEEPKKEEPKTSKPRDLFASSVFPSAQPVARVIRDEEMQLPYTQRMVANIADDPDAKMRFYAAKLQETQFPDKTPEQVMQDNMRIVDGEIVYTLGEPATETGSTVKYYSAEPAGVVGQLAQDLPGMTPELVLSAGLGAAGTAAPIPGAGPGGAALGAAGGEGIRKTAANIILGEEQTSLDNVASMAEAGAWAAGGEMFLKGLGRLFRKSEAKDVADLDLDDAMRLEQMAGEYGITLTPAQSSGLQSLMARQKVLMNSPEGQNIMRQFFDVQNEQIQKGVYQLFDEMSDIATPREGFIKGRDALIKRKMDLENRRSLVANKMYDKAFNAQKAPIDTSSLVDDLKSKLPDAGTGQANTINRVVGELTDANSGELKTSLRALHNAKIEVDELLKNAKRGTGSAANMNVKILNDARKDLINIIDSQSPDYKAARNKFEEMSAPINKLDESVAGDLMKYSDSDAYKFGRTLFSEASSPSEVSKTLKTIEAMNPAAADAVRRSYLQSVFEKSLKETQQGTIEQVGGKARKAMFGSVLDKRMMRAAMTPQQYKSFTDLMEVLQATTRGTSKGSDTAFNQAEQALMKEEAKGALSKAADVATLSKARILEGLDQIRLGNYTKEMAELFTSGASVQEYRKAANVLAKANPNSKAYWSALGTIVGNITGQTYDLNQSGQDSKPK